MSVSVPRRHTLDHGVIAYRYRYSTPCGSGTTLVSVSFHSGRAKLRS